MQNIVMVLLVSAALQQAAPKTAPAKLPVLTKPIAQMSQGDLFKNGEAYFKAGRLPEAREMLMAGLDKKKKDDPKYTPMLKQINDGLADEEAAAGENSCKQVDLVNCEKQIAAAKKYATTPRVTRLSNTLTTTVADLQKQQQDALRLAGSGEYDRALVQLKRLTTWSTHLPSVTGDIDKTTKSFVQKLVSDGMKSIDDRRWEDSSQQFQRVLELDKDNATAKAGMNTITRARAGYDQETKAQAQFAARNYDKALELIDAAINTYPEAAEFEQVKNRFIQDFVGVLAAPIPDLLASANDLAKTKDAYLRLDQIRQLDPGNAVIAKYLPSASEAFGANILLHATDLENIVDYSKIATAYTMKLAAKQRLPEGLVKADDIKGAAAAFGRKRLSHIIVSADNLSSNVSAAAFAQTLQQRSRHGLESLSLPDLRICTSEDKKCVSEDPQFEGSRPDGKSRVGMLTVTVSRYEFDQQHSDTQSLRSKWINGTEDIPNPEYRAKSDEMDRMRRALDKPGQKKDKPTPEGWTEATFAQKERELARIDKTIKRDKIVDYSYSKTEYRQRTNVELNVELRDYSSRQQLVAQRVRSTRPEVVAEEIEGVKDTDVNNMQNKRLRLPSREEALDAAGLQIAEELDKRLQEMLPSYTNRFFNEGEKRMKSGQVDDAVEAFICHFAFMRGKLPQAQMERVADVVRKETGFDLKREGDAFLALLD